nr:hypothetical protein [Tanacetum cinerariifolium]
EAVIVVEEKVVFYSQIMIEMIIGYLYPVAKVVALEKVVAEAVIVVEEKVVFYSQIMIEMIIGYLYHVASATTFSSATTFADPLVAPIAVSCALLVFVAYLVDLVIDLVVLVIHQVVLVV